MQEHNNALLERARKAEAALRNAEAAVLACARLAAALGKMLERDR